MRKTKLTDNEIERYLSALEEYYKNLFNLDLLPSHSEVYYLYRTSQSKRLWRDLGESTGLDRTKIYKHYSFTYTRRFHPDIQGRIQNQLNELIRQGVDVSAFEKTENLHHDAVDQYIRYEKRKSQKETPGSSPHKNDGGETEGIEALLLAVMANDAPLAGLLL